MIGYVEMKVSTDILYFLQRKDIQKHIESGDFATVYGKAIVNLLSNDIGGITELFYEADIDPLDYMSYVPASFLYGTSIRSFVIPSHIEDINSYAFGHCNDLTHIYIPGNLKSVRLAAFSRCPALKTISIPDSVATIDNNAFTMCRSLETVTIGRGVESIKADAFLDCNSLKEIDYKGTVAMWRRVNKAKSFDSGIIIHCSDGSLQLRGNKWVRI